MAKLACAALRCMEAKGGHILRFGKQIPLLVDVSREK